MTSLAVVKERVAAIAAAAGAEAPTEQLLRQDSFRGEWGWSGQHIDLPNMHTAGEVVVDTWEQLVAFVAAAMPPYRQIGMVQRLWPRQILRFRPDGSVLTLSGPLPWQQIRPDTFANPADALIAYYWPTTVPSRWRAPGECP